MKRVFKYAIEQFYGIKSDGTACLSMPEDAVIIHVGCQEEINICLWAEVDDTKPRVERVFHIVGTGHPIPIPGFDEYRNRIGTVLMCDGNLVWHIYEMLKKSQG